MAADYRGMFMAKLQEAGVTAALHPTEPGRVILFPSDRVTADIRADLFELRAEVLEWIREGASAPSVPATATEGVGHV